MVATTLKQQSNALLRKNLVYQRRRIIVNVSIILLPLLFVGLLKGLQEAIDNLLDDRSSKCGCLCIQCCNEDDDSTCRDATPERQCGPEEECKKYDDDICGLQFSDPDQVGFCEISHPASWPPVMDIPSQHIRAFPWNPLAVMFFAGDNADVAIGIKDKMLPPFVAPSIPSLINNKFLQMAENQSVFRGEYLTQAGMYFGTDAEGVISINIEPAFVGEGNLSFISRDCSAFQPELIDGFDIATRVRDTALLERPDLALSEEDRETEDNGGDEDNEEEEEPVTFAEDCVNTPFVLSDVERINRHLFCSFEKARCNASEELEETINSRRLLDEPDTVAEYSHAWDFKDTGSGGLNVDIWYKDKDIIEGNDGVGDFQRINLAQNLAADSWLKWTLNGTYSSKLLALMEMPKPGTKLRLEISSFLSRLLFTWIVQLFLPLMLVQLVYEKENNLRIMMKMHGLGDAAYWTVYYMYYLVLYILYIAIFLIVGSAVDLAIFRLNDYGVQILFYFMFGNVQIAFSFLLSNFFHHTQTAMAFSFLWVFGTGLLGEMLFALLIERDVFYSTIIQVIPAFGAYRGLYEMAEYSFRAAFRNTDGLTFDTFDEKNNDMDIIFIIFLLEWPIFMLAAWYLEQVISSGTGVHRHPLYFLGYTRTGKVQKKRQASTSRYIQDTSLGVFNRLRNSMCGCCQGRPFGNHSKEIGIQETVLPESGKSHTHVEISEELADVQEEYWRVQNISEGGDDDHSIVIRGLRKVFPGFSGAPKKVAVKNLHLAVRRGEVFGLLGPNGAGKTTTLNMLVGFLEPTAGSAVVEGFDIAGKMDKIYDLMGVCPQHNLLWATLTGREHLLFYGRLKGLAGNELEEAVTAALKAVHLYAAEVGEKLVKMYSGGMKRRLSVAISLIGSPKVVYLDEPSTGLDPASRRNLWDVVRDAKQDKAIILTTHSMKEAEVLCDRLGVFVNGRLMVIGNPKELASRYGEYLVFTLITSPEETGEAKRLVHELSQGAKESYELAGTLVFELPTQDVTPSGVFTFMERVKSRIQVLDWGIANATLEEVFIKIASKTGAATEELH